MTEAALETAVTREKPRDSFAFSFAVDGIWLVLLLGLILRLILAFFKGFDVDMSLFLYWSQQLADRGPWHFYDQDFFTDYAPGYMYVLFVIGKLDQLFGFNRDTYEYILKIPAIVADLASAYILWRLLEGKESNVRLGAAALYLLMPPVLLIGPIWGQVDSVLAFFLLLSVYYISRGRPVAGAVAFTVGFLVKPQAIAALPVLAFWIMKENPPKWVRVSLATLEWFIGALLILLGAATGVLFHLSEHSGAAIAGVIVASVGVALVAHRLLTDTANADTGEPAPALGGIPAVPRLWLYITGISVAVLVVLIFPFFVVQPWDLISQMKFSTEVYKVNSFWAFNFWNMFGLFDCGFKADEYVLDQNGIPPGEACAALPVSNGEIMGIAARIWGIAMFVVAECIILFSLRKKEGAGWLSLGVALSILAFYMFVTRMHERYVFPMVLPLLAASVLINSRLLWALFVGVVAAHFFNLYHVYIYYNSPPENPNELKWGWAYDIFQDADFLGMGLETVQVLSAVLVLGLLALLGFALFYKRSATDPEPA
jgi:Gpi18-like mannosyltransferase